LRSSTSILIERSTVVVQVWHFVHARWFPTSTRKLSHQSIADHGEEPHIAVIRGQLPRLVRVTPHNPGSPASFPGLTALQVTQIAREKKDGRGDAHQEHAVDPGIYGHRSRFPWEGFRGFRADSMLHGSPGSRHAVVWAKGHISRRRMTPFVLWIS
jgi:hypothetical protein